MSAACEWPRREFDQRILADAERFQRDVDLYFSAFTSTVTSWRPSLLLSSNTSRP